MMVIISVNWAGFSMRRLSTSFSKSVSRFESRLIFSDGFFIVTITTTLSFGIPDQFHDCHSEGNLVSAVDIALQRYCIWMLRHNLPGFLLNDSVELVPRLNVAVLFRFF